MGDLILSVHLVYVTKSIHVYKIYELKSVSKHLYISGLVKKCRQYLSLKLFTLREFSTILYKI